ncbi:glycosyltransferase [Jiulongibacter sp. NS-SX5]|uniref:glycosyltransferase n=1 Tax=Jiulongibacter sp. NS-SX5 TaxID=3463854 RepID=UPI004059CAF8
MKKPKVSILIALRNEEKNAPSLINSLKQLDFPKDEFEILLGNDDSSDKTGSILHEFAKESDHVKAFDIPPKTAFESQEGKARVLAQLAQKAKGDYFFFTDADITLPRNWIQSLLDAFLKNENTGVVVGITGMPPKTLPMAMQSMEWLTVLYMLHLFSRAKVPGTGMGNNMAVSREAYVAVGGYENIPFSIVEDYSLYKAIIDKGYDFNQLFNENCFAMTVPPENYLVQRRRWLRGGFQSSSILLLPALIQAFWIPLLVIVYFLSSTWFWGLLVGQALLMAVLCILWGRQIKKYSYLKFIPLFIIYLPIVWNVITIYSLLPGKIKWKGREF